MKVCVDVRLCGAIPRSELPRGAPCVTSRASYLAAANALASEPTGIGSKNGPTEHKTDDPTRPLPPLQPINLTFSNNNTTTTNNSNNEAMTHHSMSTPPQLQPLLEPPQWAVPAQGDARLEPVGESVGTHAPVDLTQRCYFRIGRSPASDVQLLHGTSSRRHAMLFHHPNGSCYLVDCGSAHGTYVNGHRILTQSRTAGGWVVPHKVRRGSLIRFGGPGAPSFVLKSFSLGFSAMVSLDEEDEEQTLVPGGANDKHRMENNRKWLLQVNTRLNALGASVSTNSRQGTGGALMETSGNIMPALKRSLENDDSCKQSPTKRSRCMSPPLLPEQPLRLVSPEGNHGVSHYLSSGGLTSSLLSKSAPRRYGRRVTFSDSLVPPIPPALVSADDSSSDGEPDSTSSLEFDDHPQLLGQMA